MSGYSNPGNTMDRVFRIDDFIVEPQLSRKRRDDKSSYVEHKAMEVLVFLAEHPDE